MLVWTLVLLTLTPHPPSVAGQALSQRHFATALECERSAATVALPADERLVCLPSEGASAPALAAAF
ncbi:hypothetical protein [Roseomonas rosulenta]|uniref:hypothetical protein n=1 Tax=Roseomonas rosulenta TaxID=2748667 RepID=UPI0018DF4BB0|nr:hypothetical protein [Roseomonas rosulenta]